MLNTNQTQTCLSSLWSVSSGDYSPVIASLIACACGEINWKKILPFVLDFFPLPFFFLLLASCSEGLFTAADTLFKKISKSFITWFKMSYGME